MFVRMRVFSFLCSLLLTLMVLGSQPGAEVRPTVNSESKREARGKDQSFTIALIAKSSVNPVFLLARKGAETAAQELSRKHGIKVRIDWQTPEKEDPLEQGRRVSKAVEQRVNAILISCIDAERITGSINSAVDKGVPVMTFDSDAPRSKRFAFYGADDEEIGRKVMMELTDQLGGKGEVAILAGNRHATNIQKRLDAAKNQAGKTPGIHILGTFCHIETAEDATDEVLRVMKAYPRVDGWAMLGGWALFGPKLLSSLEPGRVKIVAVDALKEQLPYVEKGIVQVLIAQPNYMWGYFSVQKIFEHAYLDKAVYEINKMDLVRVTKENLKTWQKAR